MAWLRDWSWKIAILALPWQTRYVLSIIPTPEAGFQTEWGIYAIYASWILIANAWLLSLSRQASKIHLTKIGWLVIGLLLLPIVITHSAYSLQFIGQILALVLLVDTLRRNQVTREQVAAWFLCSLIPHVVLAVLQFDAQSIVANKWLGIAAQNPATPGVSVIGPERTLRAYAGFPHPNIAGMWFTLGIAVSFWLVRRAMVHWQIVLAWIMSAILPVALVLTFSRSAWLAALVVLALTLASCLRRPIDVYTLRVIILSILCALIATIPVLPHIIGRTSIDTRLETRSIDERASTWQGIWPIIAESPIVGHGMGQSIPVMQSHGLGNQPPHALPLIGLLETGLLGFSVIFISILLHWKNGSATDRALLAIFFFPAMTDHYLWSLWSGQILACFCTIWFILKVQNIDKDIKF
jgi:O-antigen ligase